MEDFLHRKINENNLTYFVLNKCVSGHLIYAALLHNGYVRLPSLYVVCCSCPLARTARVILGLDSSDIFCNSDYKHFLA
jgi:hypothetical protein